MSQGTKEYIGSYMCSDADRSFVVNQMTYSIFIHTTIASTLVQVEELKLFVIEEAHYCWCYVRNKRGSLRNIKNRETLARKRE